jgi:hypothetical protein
LAALALDGKRIQENRADIVFCVKKSKIEPQRKEWVRTAFQEYYVPMVFNKYTQGVIFLIASCLITISAMGCIKLK